MIPIVPVYYVGKVFRPQSREERLRQSPAISISWEDWSGSGKTIAAQLVSHSTRQKRDTQREDSEYLERVLQAFTEYWSVHKGEKLSEAGRKKHPNRWKGIISGNHTGSGIEAVPNSQDGKLPNPWSSGHCPQKYMLLQPRKKKSWNKCCFGSI